MTDKRPQLKVAGRRIEPAPAPTRIPFRCRLGFHPWPQWGPEEQCTVKVNDYVAGVRIGEEHMTTWVQERRCLGCGQLARRRSAGIE